MPELLEINTALIELEDELKHLKKQSRTLESARETTWNVIHKYEENMLACINLVNMLVNQIEGEKGALSKGTEDILSAASSASYTLNELLVQLQDQQERFLTNLDITRKEVEGFDFIAQQILIEQNIKALSDSSESFTGTISRFLQEVEDIGEKQSSKIIIEQKRHLEPRFAALQQTTEEYGKVLQQQLQSELEPVTNILAKQEEQIERQIGQLKEARNSISENFKTFQNHLEASQISQYATFTDENKRLLQDKVVTLQQNITEQGKKLESHIHGEIITVRNELEQSIQAVREASSNEFTRLKQELSSSQDVLVAKVQASREASDEGFDGLKQELSNFQDVLFREIHTAKKASEEGLEVLKQELSSTQGSILREFKNQKNLQIALLGIILLNLVITIAFRYL